jgi:hypothetical protein
VLTARKVDIQFFHRLKTVTANGTGAIGALKLNRQADIVGGGPYDPFRQFPGKDWWPDAPDWSQLVNGQALAAAAGGAGVDFEDSNEPTTAATVTLAAGADFDVVVLAVPPDTLKAVAGNLADPRWQAMLNASSSVATRSYQAWLKAPTSSLGFSAPTPVTACPPPFSTWADMSHLLSQETWPQPAPQSLQYFCGTITAVAAMPGTPNSRYPDGDFKAAASAMWPTEPDPQVDLTEKYARTNTDLSERYVQVPPGSVAARLAPDSLVYSNLYLAGDWTLTRFSGGCVENAVVSALAAAQSISGDPTLGG